jgi:3-hydroxyacyl-[acyl-carrier-protein] dehydratase
MRFALLDRIVTLEPGVRITAVKSLALAEEYLADHFPRAPVMPGVLMLEGLTEAAAWLVRATEDFAHSMVTLKEARNVKFANFLEPGQTLDIAAEVVGGDERETKFKAQATVAGAATVSARLVLSRYNLADAEPTRAATDVFVRQALRERFAVLWRPGLAAA